MLEFWLKMAVLGQKSQFSASGHLQRVGSLETKSFSLVDQPDPPSCNSGLKVVHLICNNLFNVYFRLSFICCLAQKDGKKNLNTKVTACGDIEGDDKQLTHL